MIRCLYKKNFNTNNVSKLNLFKVSYLMLIVNAYLTE